MNLSKLGIICSFLLKIADCNLVLSSQANLSLRGPFLQGHVPTYSQYGAVDVLTESIQFGRQQPRMGGAIWSKVRNEHKEWQITFKVRITGGKVGGDGLAFWYTKEGHSAGPIFGAPDLWTGLGLILDSYDDDGKGNNPAVMGILNDGTMNYKLLEDGEGQYFGGCLRNIRNLDQPFYVRVSNIMGVFKVELDDSTNGQKFINCFEKREVRLPAGYYFGFSGSTNDVPDTMELLDFQMFSIQNSNMMYEDGTPNLKANKDASNEGLSAIIETAMERQIQKYLNKKFVERTNVDLRPVEGRLEQMNNYLERVIGMASSMDGTPSKSKGLENFFEQIKVRLDQLQVQLAGEREKYYSYINENAKNLKASSGIFGSGLVWFIALEVIILSIFLFAKHKLDARKKWA